MSVKTIGFNFITVEALTAAYEWIMEEGTCCLAYGDWTNKAEDLLLTPEQKIMRKNCDDIAWDEMDSELIEAIVMLPVLKMLNTSVLYWKLGQVSVTPICCPDFMLDFSGVLKFNTLTELHNYCCDSLTEDGNTITVTVAAAVFDTEDGPASPRSISYNISCAADFNCLERILDIWKEEGFQNYTFSAIK